MDDPLLTITKPQNVRVDSAIEHALQALQLYKPQPDLCTQCAAVDLKSWLSTSAAKPMILGTWAELNRKPWCQLCRLALRSLRLKQILPSKEALVILTNAPSWELAVELSPYDRLRSETNSNKLDLKSRAKDEASTAYRIVVLAEGHAHTAGLIQQILPRDSFGLERAFTGRTMRSDKVDVALLESWLQRCGTVHEENCGEDGLAGNDLPPNLRLIDVEERAIVRRDDNKSQDYVTLSYVWGSDRMRAMGLEPIVLNRSDIRYKFGKEWTPVRVRMAQTIEDAIKLTGQLGFRYLWVDALCIVQDEAVEEKRVHLDRMHAIYNCSALTLVAGSGPHANAGLPGISMPRHRSQSVEYVQGYHLAAMAPSYTDLENSTVLPWNSRAWTFQEKVLAKRIMLFTEYQVYFKCSEAIWTEELVLESNKLSKSYRARRCKYRWAADRPQHISKQSKVASLIGFVMPKLDGKDQWKYLGPFPDYAAAVQEYTKRALTDRADILLAISGVFKTLQHHAGDFLFGHPSGYFAQSLLWYPRPGSAHARVDQTIPSWSWAAWRTDQGIMYDVLDIRLLRTVMVIMRKLLRKTVKAIEQMHERASHPSGSHSTDSDMGTSPLDMSSPDTTGATGPSQPSSTIQAIQDFSVTEAWGFNPASVAWRASKNIASCFGWPVLIRDHTVKNMFLCEDGRIIHMPCAETMSIETFASEEIHSEKQAARKLDHKTDRDTRQYLRRVQHKYDQPILCFKTHVINFRIGRRLSHSRPTNANEAGLYELLIEDRRCAGEVWLTKEAACHGIEHGIDFFTISWGLSLTEQCELDDELIPRWTFDAAKLPKSETLENVLPVIQQAFEAPAPDPNGQWPKQPSVASFVGALLTAKKDEARPRFLWSVVNLLAVRRERGLWYRIGVGKVIFRAWQMHLLTVDAEDVKLA